MVITSRSNPIFKEVLKLKDKKYRKLFCKYLVEGVKPVDECLAAGKSVDYVICTEKFCEKYFNPVIFSDELFAAISDEKTPQGAIAVVNMPKNELKPPKKSCILLDMLQDPGNLGTIIRTANAAGYNEVYLINCTDPYSPKAVRASMSGIFFTEIVQGSEEEILDVLKGVPLICADMDGENIFSFNPPEKFCLCVGNEGSGISQTIKNRAEKMIKIPMAESCESLNAAISAAVAMYILKQSKFIQR